MGSGAIGRTPKLSLASSHSILRKPTMLYGPSPTGARLMAAVFAAMLAPLVLCGPAMALPPMAFPADTKTICKTISEEAQARGLPESYFARLINKESLFDPHAVSPKGAQGIAQFMPDTAKFVGLINPFSPVAALQASAELLSELKAALGNLGLAAAAYNAGKNRVLDWLSGKQSLPTETLNYVLSITGRPASDWQKETAEHPIPPIGKGEFVADCLKLATRVATAEVSSASPTAVRKPSGLPSSLKITLRKPAAEPVRSPWGVQLAGAPSDAVALKMFETIRAKHSDLLGNLMPLVVWKRNPGMGPKPVANVRIGKASRQEAENFCTKLLGKGVPCVALRN